jgi:hypothetical protein
MEFVFNNRKLLYVLQISIKIVKAYVLKEWLIIARNMDHHQENVKYVRLVILIRLQDVFLHVLNRLKHSNIPW